MCVDTHLVSHVVLLIDKMPLRCEIVRGLVGIIAAGDSCLHSESSRVCNWFSVTEATVQSQNSAEFSLDKNWRLLTLEAV